MFQSKAYIDRTKTIKNVVTRNEELTAEEWKRRYEKERDKNFRLKQSLASMAAELMKWRQGEKVSPDEQQQPLADLYVIANLTAGEQPAPLAPGVSPSQSLMSMFSGSALNLAAGSGGASAAGDSSNQRAAGSGGASDEELSKLYAQMDEKVTASKREHILFYTNVPIRISYLYRNIFIQNY